MNSENFEEKKIDCSNLAYYENNYIPITPVFNIEEAFKTLNKRPAQTIQHRLETINDRMKVSLSVFHRYSYKDMFDNNKFDVFCTSRPI